MSDIYLLGVTTTSLIYELQLFLFSYCTSKSLYEFCSHLEEELKRLKIKGI